MQGLGALSWFPQDFSKHSHTTDRFHSQMSIKTKKQYYKELYLETAFFQSSHVLFAACYSVRLILPFKKLGNFSCESCFWILLHVCIFQMYLSSSSLAVELVNRLVEDKVQIFAIGGTGSCPFYQNNFTRIDDLNFSFNVHTVCSTWIKDR